MKRLPMMVLAGFVTALFIAPSASADPLPPLCFDQRLCGDQGSVTYCPDTGRMVGPYSACPGLVTGPYAPGGLRPNGGDDGY